VTIERENARLEYVVVFRARSAARFLPDEGWETTLNVPDLNVQQARIRSMTRWVGTDGQQIPRELMIEVKLQADSLDDAVLKASRLSDPVGAVAAFVANVQVGRRELHLAFEVTADALTRPFLEVFVPDETGSLSEGKAINASLMSGFFTAYVTHADDSPRISRALHHYEIALRQWFVGGEWLALNHLWIAAENLTNAVVRKALVLRACSEEELAQELGLVTDDPDRPRWRDLLGARVREELIFGGDSPTYSAAKDASNGLEHGFWELDRVAANALECAYKTFQHIRDTIIWLLDVAEETAAELRLLTPRDTQSARKVVHGELVGMAEDPAPPDEWWPRIEWRSTLSSVDRDGTTLRANQVEQMTVRTHPDVGFRLRGLEVRGRLEEGKAPVEYTDEDVNLQPTPSPTALNLLDRALAVLNSASSTTSGEARNRAQQVCFNFFALLFSHLEAIAVLVRAEKPVEALPLLHAIVILSARFEQISDPRGNLLGVALRIALNDSKQLGADLTVIEQVERLYLADANSAGLSVPEKVDSPGGTSIYHALGSEMLLARGSITGSYTAASLHLERLGPQTAIFHVNVPSGPLSNAVSDLRK